MARSPATGGTVCGIACRCFSLRRAARLFAGDTDFPLSRAIPIDRAFASRVERLPGDSGRVVNPRLLGLGVAADGVALLNHGSARLAQARIDFSKLGFALDLDTQVIQACAATSRRDR